MAGEKTWSTVPPKAAPSGAPSTFDAAGELGSRVLSASGADAAVGLSYDAAGRATTLARSSGGSSAGETDMLYDAAGLVTSLITADAGGGGLVSEAYTYDSAGRLHTRTTFGVSTVAYTYDAAGQLLSAGVVTYGYDANGVPDTGGRTVGSNNQVSSDGLWTYTYDDAGELVEKTQGSGGPTWTYRSDVGGELVEAAYSATGGTPTIVVDYVYDVFGSLVGRTETDSGTVMSDERYAVDGWDTAHPEAIGSENYDTYAVLVPDGSGGWQVSARTAFGAGFDEPVATVTSASGRWRASMREPSTQTNRAVEVTR